METDTSHLHRIYMPLRILLSLNAQLSGLLQPFHYMNLNISLFSDRHTFLYKLVLLENLLTQ